MTWTAYRITLRVLSPIHIGWRKLGNLQQTRPYITGRNLWGALTARLTRELGSSNYGEIGQIVDRQLVFTYFYPSLQRDVVSLWPWHNQRDDFAWTFLGSYTSTALKAGYGAEPGSLHEVEFIVPYPRHEKQQLVYLVGYIFEQDNCDLRIRHWQRIINKIQIGGGRNYGWGRVQLDQIVEDSNCFDHALFCDAKYPQIILTKDDALLAHTIALEDMNVEGSIEPLVGRETNYSGFGKVFSKPQICWIPGGKVTKETVFHIKDKGVWEQ